MEQQTISNIIIGAIIGIISGYFIKTFETLISTPREERIKAIHALELAKINYYYQISIASLDKRLDITQEAFVLWWKLIVALHTSTIDSVCKECEAWWIEHSIFLPP
jgi:hypothetical protein